MPRDALVPPLVLQPLLENAVYHGIEPRSEPGVISVNIYARRATSCTRCCAIPIARTSDHHAGNRMALANIRERLQLHFDAEARRSTTKVSDDTYQVRIVMPYIKSRETMTRAAALAGGDRRRRGAGARAAARPAGGLRGELPLDVVGEAANGREALELLAAEPADVVLLDIRMPDMDGIEVAQHLQQARAAAGGDVRHRLRRLTRSRPSKCTRSTTC